ncbi:hypothetical protein AGMMS50293_15970 [Spirochaetia bacterium]|nr:hypothetical protein AGMMS50293_15970 [Spirochaetia bacterium]
MEPTMGLTFEKVWAMFEETALRSKETDRKIEETARQMKETAQQMKETDKKIGQLGNKLGTLIESTVLPNIENKFRKLGYEFTRSNSRVRFRDLQTNRVLAEVDILIEDGDYVMAVEVKTHLSTEDIDEHVERMGIIRNYLDEHNDKRKYLGTVAGGIVDDSVKNYAQKKGFFVLEPSGDTIKIAELPQDWKPREW